MSNACEVTMRTCTHHNDGERVAARMWEHHPGCPVCAMNQGLVGETHITPSDQVISPPQNTLLPWQPIETAPKDGTVIDLWANGNRRTDCYWGKPDHSCGEAGEYCDSDWHTAEPGWVDSCFGEFLHVKDPTHWLPTPAAPSVGAGVEQDLGKPEPVADHVEAVLQKARYLFSDHQMYSVLDSAISMFFEYRDQHGKEEDAAKHAAVQEIIEGLDAEQELIAHGEVVRTPSQIILSPAGGNSHAGRVSSPTPTVSEHAAGVELELLAAVDRELAFWDRDGGPCKCGTCAVCGLRAAYGKVLTGVSSPNPVAPEASEEEIAEQLDRDLSDLWCPGLGQEQVAYKKAAILTAIRKAKAGQENVFRDSIYKILAINHNDHANDFEAFAMCRDIARSAKSKAAPVHSEEEWQCLVRTNAGHMEQLQKAFDQVKSLSKRLSLTNQPRRQKCLSPETVAIVGEAITEAVCACFMEWNTGRKGIKAPLGLRAAVYEEVSQVLTNGVEV